MAQSLSGTVGIRFVQGPYCLVLYRTTSHRADGGLFYHKLLYITVNTEIKLSAGGLILRAVPARPLFLIPTKSSAPETSRRL